METMMLKLDEVQIICTKMLKDITSLCEEYDIMYYVMYGTLLGTIRHEGPIPWDPDIDLYMPEFEISRFIQYVQERYSNEYWIEYRNEGMPPKSFPRVGLKGYKTSVIHIDVFRMTGLSDNTVERLLMTKLGYSLRVLRRIKEEKEYKNKKQALEGTFIKTITFFIPTSMIIKLIDYLCNKYRVFSTDYVGRVLGNRAIFKRELFDDYVMKSYTDFDVRVPIGYHELLTILFGDYMTYPDEAYRKELMNQQFLIEPI